MWNREALEDCIKKKVKERDTSQQFQASLSSMSTHNDSTVPECYQSVAHSLDSGHVSADVSSPVEDYNKRFSVPNLLAYNKLNSEKSGQRRSTIGDLTCDHADEPMDKRRLNLLHVPKSTNKRRPSLAGTLDDDFNESVSMTGVNVQNGINESLERTAGNGGSQDSVHNRSADDSHSIATTVEVEEEVEEDDSWRPYDVFQLSERDSDASDSIFKELLKILRLVLYVFLVLAILATTVTSRLSLFLLTSGINEDKQSLSVSMVLLLFCICAPIGWNWLLSFMKILFGGKEWPSVKTLFVLTVLELLQTCGISLLVFKVLPSTDFFCGIVITFAVFQVPSFLQMLFSDYKLTSGLWNCLKLVGITAAFVCQVGSAVLFTLTDFTSSAGPSITVDKNATFSLRNLVQFGYFTWEIPVALGLVSLGFWQNFISGEWFLCMKVHCCFKSWRNTLHNVKETSYFLIGPLKIGLTVLLARLITNSGYSLPDVVARTDGDVVGHLATYSLMYIQIGSGIICTYLAGLACKLHMQRMSFALPLLLSPPVSLGVVYLQCRYAFLPSHWHDGEWACPRLDLIPLVIPLGCAGALWISYCLITSHIWFPKCERMAKIERLFVTPNYNGIFPDYNLTMRRRRYELDVVRGRCESSKPGVPGLDSVTPMLYVCATMWHETRKEMSQLLKSLYRLDYMHCASRLAQEKFLIRDPDYFDLEIHIIFDDAFEYDNETDRFVPNTFVLQLVEVMEDAARSVVKGPIVIPPPTKIPTPYGGRLVWTMPGQTQLIIHCKNKNKIRHRKRWSQCMYMYYLLGFRLLGGRGSNKTSTDSDGDAADSPELPNNSIRNRKKRNSRKGQKQKSVPLKTLLMRMPPEKYEQILQKAERCFILCLDGDVDFRPESVKLLMDRMKKNKKVGAVCGRIHPIGSGPMVWYQQFEYAIGHWLQKAAEHVFGCVLCCPGCFSLFRGSALMDDNVLKMYTTKPTEARHYIQFEQGEDRWLCTLLLQQGHRIDYCAGADALTFAPETFNEFFNQRRRWSPSTLANLMDLLESWRETVRMNDNISRPYIFYQFILIASTVLAPATVILMITGSFHSVLGLSVWWSFLLSMTPVVFYVIICLTQKNTLQITIAAVLTALYTVVMMIATVGTIISIATESFNSPNVVFLCGLVVIFVVAGLLHPQELFCLVYGALYFLVVPTTFILLTVYYLCNLNNVSWGTREMPKKLTPQEQEAADREAEIKKKKKSKTFFSLWGLVALVQELREVTRSLMGLKNEMESNALQQQQEGTEVTMDTRCEYVHKTLSSRDSAFSRTPVGWEPNPDLPFWLNIEELGHGAVEVIDDEELEFWKFTIKKYLHPLDEDKSHQEQIKTDLKLLRNNVVFIYFLLNFLWCVITLQLQGLESELKNFYIIKKYEPLSLLFLSIFAVVLLLQFFSMLVHRWGTFLHLMSSTRVDWFQKSHSEQEFAKFVLNETRRLQRLEPDMEPDPDYGDDDDDAYSSTFSDPELGEEMFSTRGSDDYFETLRSVRSDTIKRLRSQSRSAGVPILETIFEQNLRTMQSYHKNSLRYKGSSRMQRVDSKHKGPVKEHEMRQRLYTRTMEHDREQLKRIRVM
ncbi:chitin synthase chs-2-like [Gigantopelta aegis]|uniref:chitin synthase chs-2-like n=1 Tax=Gigantopelta aegis TaxID=1735272 RepID=UPI001B88C0AD|nr:chitin synthase chs-2-like [Gigantopelta aegis]XP_041366856.1 chitin synthase chs-2-like [Gigantopelta aegis]XP_041366863.1 chitin synthase chs-2-like [Gigantopelta aegis]